MLAPRSFVRKCGENKKMRKAWRGEPSARPGMAQEILL
jgi:hypothetical protein